MINLQQILEHIPYALTEDLQKIMSSIQNELPKREGQLSGYIEHITDFCPDGDLNELVWAECESMELNSKKTKTATQWLSSTGEPYVYPDSSPIHSAKDITKFPSINKLLSMVNESTEVTGPLNSCLIIKYNSNQSSLSLHADDEPIFDHEKAICSFSLGCNRTIEFYEKARRPKLVKKIEMSNNSLVIMRPGTQQHLKHCVRAEPRRGNIAPAQVRYSLSFRAAKKAPVVAQPASSSAPVVTQSVQPRKRTCLIAGDSFAARMDTVKLSKGKISVVKIADGGSKLHHVQKQLEDFAASNPETEVTKLIVSVGTNDIRNCKEGVNHLRGPLKELCNTIDTLFPSSTVFFQSLLPLPLKNAEDWVTNSTVLDFNRIIYNECIYRRYYLIEAFYPFTKFDRRWNEPPTRFNRLFEVKGIHPNPERGMGVLARMYIRALHSKYFLPCVFQ